MNKKSIYLSLLLCCSYNVAFLQTNLPEGKIEVIKNYDATLLESEKILLDGELPASNSTNANYEYKINPNFKEVKPELTYGAPIIRPISMPKEKLPETYIGHLKLGVGSPISMYADAGYTFLETDRYIVNISAKNHSIFKAKNKYQVFNESSIGANSTFYFNKKLALNTNVGVDLNNYRFYGGYITGDTIFDDKNTKRKFTTLKVGTKLFNASKNTINLDYFGGINLQHLKDNFGAKESNLNLTLGISKWIKDSHSINLGIDNSFVNFKDSIDKKLNKLSITPSFIFVGQMFKAKVGINLISTDSKFNIFPDVELYATLFGPSLTLFVGAKGDIEQGTFAKISNYNPFVQTNFSGPFNDKTQDYYGGISGNTSKMKYKIKAGYKTHKNYALFIQQKLDFRQFDVLLDEVNIFYLGGEISLNILPKLEIGLHALNQAASPRVETKAYGIVPFVAGISGKYQLLENKMKVTTNINLASGAPYINKNGNSGTLKANLDLNFGADYALKDNISLFLNMNNIASLKYQRWYNYPSYGFNILGGVFFKILI